MVIVGCADAGKHPLKTTDFILAGKDISEHDEAGGVVQASPGIEETDADGVVLSVPADQSLLRFKMFDDPIPSADTNGLLQFVIEYDDIRSIVQEPCGAAFIPDEIELTIEKIEIWKAGDSHRRPWQRWKPGDRMELHPTGKDAKVLIKEGRHFFPIIRGISLPAGAYNRMRVQFSQQGILRDNSEEWPVILNSRFAQYDRLFQTRAGKVTALNAVPSSEFFMGRRSHRWRSGRVAHLRHPDRKRERRFHPFHAALSVIPVGGTEHDPLDRIFLRMKRITAVSSTSFILNDSPTEIELLSLRNGAVALLGHNMLPAGTYQSFELNLEGNGRVEWGSNSAPLRIESDANDIINFEGPFSLRGGRITELFLDFDPNTSVFFTEDGWVFDPDVTVSSVTSMTPAQDARLIQALGAFGNTVASESSMIFEGSIQSVTFSNAMNMTGSRTIVSDVLINISDRLRGIPDKPAQIQLRVPGGIVDGRRLTVSGMPEYIQGEKSLFFLREVAGALAPVRGELGKINLSGPNPTRNQMKWPSDFPRIRFNAVSQTFDFASPDSLMEALRAAAREWSFTNTGAKFDLSGNGTNGSGSIFSPTTDGCQTAGRSQLAMASKSVFVSHLPDPFCTGVVCTYLISCENDALHFDVQLNGADFSFSPTVESGKFHLAGALVHAFGHVAGPGHCLPGDTESQCQARLDSDPSENSAMYKFLETAQTRSVTDGEMYLMHQLYGSLNVSEIAKVAEAKLFLNRASSFCTTPCLFPDEETNPLYQMAPDEIAVVQQHASDMAQGEARGYLTERAVAQNDLLYQQGFLDGRKSAEAYMTDVMDKAETMIALSDTPILAASRDTLSIQIENKREALSRFGFTLDANYALFTEAELKVLIQLRRKFIDEMARR